MRKILTIMLLSTALPGIAMAQGTALQGDTQLSVNTAVETSVEGVKEDAKQATDSAATVIEGATPTEINAAEKMEAEIKTGAEPVLNTGTTATTNTTIETPAAAATTTTDTTVNTGTAPGSMGATTDASTSPDSKTPTEIKAEQPDAAPTEATVPQDASTAVTADPGAPAGASADATDPAKANEAAASAATTTAVETPETPAVDANAAIAVKTKANLSRANVRKLQESLKASGSYNGKIDGAWGDQTSAAISDYQSKNGLGVTGVLDQATIDKLGINFKSSAKHKAAAKVDANDPANKALESRVVDKTNMPAAAATISNEAGAMISGQPAPAAVAPTPAQTPAATAPAAPMDPAAPAEAVPPPAAAPAQGGSSYSTTY